MNSQVSIEIMLGLAMAMLIWLCAMYLLLQGLAAYRSGIAAGAIDLGAANRSANGMEGLCWCLKVR